jgi:hypothetical protein
MSNKREFYPTEEYEMKPNGSMEKDGTIGTISLRTAALIAGTGLLVMFFAAIFANFL